MISLKNRRFHFSLAMPLVFISIFMMSCGPGAKETNEPIFKEKEPVIDGRFIEITMTTEISPVTIKTSFLRRLVKAIVGWIPIAGDLAEIPFDLVGAFLPHLPFSEIWDIPEGADLNDPEVLRSLDFVQLSYFEFYVTPPEKRGPKYKKGKCYVVFKCKDQDLGFIRELRVYLESKNNQNEQILIARGTQKNNMSADRKQLILEPVPDVNLVPYIANMDSYEIRTVVEAKPPKRTLYLSGRLSLKLKIKF